MGAEDSLQSVKADSCSAARTNFRFNYGGTIMRYLTKLAITSAMTLGALAIATAPAQAETVTVSPTVSSPTVSPTVTLTPTVSPTVSPTVTP